MDVRVTRVFKGFRLVSPAVSTLPSHSPPTRRRSSRRAERQTQRGTRVAMTSATVGGTTAVLRFLSRGSVSQSDNAVTPAVNPKEDTMSRLRLLRFFSLAPLLAA